MLKPAYNNRRKFIKSRGQSVVEMALLLPILLVLVLSALEVGRLFYSQLVINNAAREAAYYLSLNVSNFNAATAVAQAETQNSGVGEINVSFAAYDCCTPGLYRVGVTVEAQVPNIIILGFITNTLNLRSIYQGGFPLSATVEMMVQ